MIKYLEKDQLDAMMVSAPAISPYMPALVGVMAMAGLRVSEAVSLTIHQLTSFGQLSNTITIPAKTTKNQFDREIPISPTLRPILENHIAFLKNRSETIHWLFPGTLNNHLSVRAAQLAIARLGRISIAKRVTPHMLRHTFGTMVAQKANIRVVQELLGHKSLESTMIYTHVLKNQLRTSIDQTFPLHQKTKTLTQT